MKFFIKTNHLLVKEFKKNKNEKALITPITGESDKILFGTVINFSTDKELRCIYDEHIFFFSKDVTEMTDPETKEKYLIVPEENLIGKFKLEMENE